MSEPIKIWPFYDAPEHLREMSQHGGDEDYIALVPAEYENENLVWKFEETGILGCCSTDRYDTPEGIVFIGAHA